MERQYTVITGEQGKVYTLIEEFFNDLEQRIDERYHHLLEQNPNPLMHPLFERRMLGVRVPEFEHGPQRPDDYFHMLLYEDKVVAVVSEQRNTGNYVQFSFFDNLDDVLQKSEE